MIIFVVPLKGTFAEEKSLSLKDALDIALKNNHHIKSAIATLPIEKANLIIAKYRPNPVLGSNAEVVRGGSLHPVEVGGDIELGRKRHWRIQLAKEKISKQELEIKKVMWEIHIQVHAAYGILSVNQKLLELAKERLVFYKLLLEIANSRFEAGDISEMELIRVRTELLKAENKFSEMDGELRRAKIEFNHLLGRDPTFDLVLEDPKELKPKTELHKHPKIKEVIDNALKERIDIAILEKEFGIVRAEFKKAKWEMIPNLKILGGPVRPAQGDNIWGVFVGGGFEVPVFNRKQGEVEVVKAKLDYLEKEKDRIEHDIQIDVANSFQDLEVREEQIHTFKEKLLIESKNVLEMVKIGFEKGKLGLSDVLLTEQQSREIEEKYLQAILGYQLALASLEYAVGVPLYEFGEEL